MPVPLVSLGTSLPPVTILPSMPDPLTQLRELLRELFQLDNADLDFGIYRVMNLRRAEITRFLDHDLLPQVKAAFRQYQSSDAAGLTRELDQLLRQAADMGVADPAALPKVAQLRGQLAASADVGALEQQVFSDLYAFFRRYYADGDFLSLRRYKAGVYAIPYEGEEVKLHWANADQYYIKTSEYLRDYAFVANGKRVHFRLADADTEKDNNKAAAGHERRFVLADGPDAVAEAGGELLVRFEYRPDPEKRKQAALNDLAERRVLELTPDPWQASLAAPRAESTADPKPTVLRHHLTQYTARNTFDYFIHKNLGTFLRRELDFYVKNEVLHLDDIDSAAFPKVEQVMSRIRVLRQIAHKIIAFLAQIEDFQKRLWLKKKFVLSADWLVTVDRIPPALRDAVANNARQWAEWEKLGFRPPSPGTPGEGGGGRGEGASTDMFAPAWTTRAYLDANDKLVVDTALFRGGDPDFAATLLASDDVLAGKPTLDEATTGTLFHSENFQALSLMQERYRGQIKCVYIDPPYNTGGDGFVYKDGYQRSSWLTLMANRLASHRELLTSDGVTFISVDDNEMARLSKLNDEVFAAENFVAQIVIEGAFKNDARQIGVNHEYVQVYAKDRFAATSSWTIEKEGVEPVLAEVKRLKEVHSDDFPTASHELAGWFRAMKATPSFGLRRFRGIDARGAYKEDDPTAPGGRKIDLVNPRTGKILPLRRNRGWAFDQNEFDRLVAEGRITFVSETSVMVRRYLHETSRMTPQSVMYQPTRSASERLASKIGAGLFDFPKDEFVIVKFIEMSTSNVVGTVVLDYFGGSGTTAESVTLANRVDDGARKFVLVEMGEYFDTVLKPRIAKVMYSPDWKGGRAASHGKGVSGLVKVLRLEGYEDTLNNLRLTRTAAQADLLSQHKGLAEEYTLGYLLDTEARGSPSLLNVDAFADPFNYTLNMATGTAGETRATTVDLVETFNWLLGLRVRSTATIGGIRVVEGTNPQGERVLVLWRRVADWPNDRLNDWMARKAYTPRDAAFDLIYVNGDNNVENLRRDDEQWKVRLIEAEFGRLMFDVADV